VYLIDDTARRHGAVRVGTAMSYIRCDEPGTLATLLGDRRMKALVLHRVASTVLVSQAPASEVIATLRDSGFAPAAEAPDGTVVVRRSNEHRTATPKAAKAVTSRRNPETLITAALKALRASERSQTAPRGATVAGPASTGAIPRSSSAAIVAALKRAIADSTPMWISYADTDGTNTDQIVDPIRLGGGTMTAFDHRTEQVRSFTISRVSGIAPIEP
jgi:predicted DNA-binding transcriptional regulator YafY